MVSSRTVLLTRQFTFACLACLVGAQLIASAAQQPPLLIWVLRVAPLLIFFPGMLADRLRSYIWLCFVCLLYFVTLVLRLFADPTNPIAILGMASVVGLFVGAMLYVRWRAQELREVSEHE